MDVLVRGLPDEVHAELVRRAARRGISVRAYLIETLEHHVATPSTADWLERVSELGPAAMGGPTGPELVAASRADDDELVGR